MADESHSKNKRPTDLQKGLQGRTAAESESTLERVKPPREWRVYERPKQQPSATPRVTQHVASEAAPAPAGSPVLESLHSAPAQEPRPTPPPSGEQAPEPPARYGRDRLALLVRDPYWVYAWWELTDAVLAQGRGALGEDGRLVLRFYDISLVDWDGDNHHGFFDVDVDDNAGSWYVELNQPGASFVAELGLRATDGRFVGLVRSNAVTLPRDTMSPVMDEEWMIREEDYRRLFDLSGGSSIGLGSGEILRMLEERLRLELSSGGVSSFGISSAEGRAKSQP